MRLSKFLLTLVFLTTSALLLGQGEFQIVEYSLCSGECIEIGQNDAHCLIWVDEEGDDIGEDEQVLTICPTENEEWSSIAINADGNITSRTTYKIRAVQSESGQLDVIRYFVSKGFQMIPYLRISPDSFNDGSPNSVEKSVSCESFTNYSNEFTIDMLSHNTGLVVEEGINLIDVISTIVCEKDIKTLFTSNENFCGGSNDFNAAESDFELSEDEVIWFHLATMSNVEGANFDVLFYGYKSGVISNISDVDIKIKDNAWSEVFPSQPNDILYDGEYKVIQRSFAPWTDFGSAIFWDPNVTGPITSNDYLGDNRGFSLEEHKEDNLSTGVGVTSRLYQEATIRLREEQVILNTIATSSSTKGHFFFLQGIIGAIISDFFILDEVREYLGEEDPQVSIDPCDFESTCKRVGEVNPYYVNYVNSSLTIYSTAANKCVPIFAPPLDMRTKLNFSNSIIGGKKFLNIRGITLNKGYPSQELYIEDKAGKKVFLYTDGPRDEGVIFVELIESTYDNLGIINFAVEINEAGNFKSDIIRYYPISDAYSIFEDQASNIISSYSLSTAFNSVHVDVQGDDPQFPLEFGEQFLTITNWNQYNLQKNPAGDCSSIPCCGRYNCCNNEDD